MNPKEKAQQLVSEMLSVKMLFMRYEHAKQFALIAVDEIIQILPTSEYLEDVGNTIENRQRTYWNQVKQEIKNL